MRVLHVMAGKGHGGAELYSTDVMLSLHQSGLDQCVVLRPGAPAAEGLAKGGVRLAPDVLKYPVRPWQRAQLRRLIASEKPDIIHCWMRRAASLVPADAGRRAAVVGWFGDYEEIRHFGHCTQFVGCTEGLARYMRENGVAAEKAAYVPTFSSVDELPALDRAVLGTPAAAKILLTLSRLHPTKGLDTMLHAMRDLPDCYLWIAGDGPMLTELQRLAETAGVAARVKFLGWRTDRGALLRAADICVLPSRYEPFGTVILDAWSSNTALVACDSDGPRAHIKDRVNGMVVPADDPGALAGAIQAVLNDAGLRARIIARGHEEYLAGFTRDAVTQRWLSYYRSILPANDQG